MDTPILSTQNNLKVQASLFRDRLQVKNLEFNPLNKSDQINLKDVKRVDFIAGGPSDDPRRISLAVEKNGEERPYVISGLKTEEAYRLKEKIEELKSAPSAESPADHPFTVAGRVSQKISKEKNQPSLAQRKFSTVLRRFGKSF